MHEKNENVLYSIPVSEHIGESMVYKPPKPPAVPSAEELLQSYICDVPSPPESPDPFKMP